MLSPGPRGAAGDRGGGSVEEETRADAVGVGNHQARTAGRAARGGLRVHLSSGIHGPALSRRLLEWAEVFDNLYGTPRSAVDVAVAQGKDVILELDIQGALAVKRVRPEAVLVFIEPPSFDDLLLRLRGRGTEDPETISKRHKAAYEEVKNKGLYDHIIVNADVNKAQEELVRILEQQE